MGGSVTLQLYLPLKSQHRLLVKVQDLLEKACYVFGQNVMGDVLRKEGWDSPECVELNIWTQVFRCNEDRFGADKIEVLGKPFPDYLESIAEIRHTAVHRVRVTANRVEYFMVEAESLAHLLGDDTCGRTLLHLRRETRSVIDEFGRNKDLLELRLREKRKEIAARRVELDCIERTALETMLREDKEYQALAGANLEQAIEAPETVVHSISISEHGTGSSEDGEGESLGEPSCGSIGKVQSSVDL